MAIFIVIAVRASHPISLLGIFMFSLCPPGKCWDRVFKEAVAGNP
jgi:hypothetical protein